MWRFLMRHSVHGFIRILSLSEVWGNLQKQIKGSWATIICLVDGGQEVNTGEAGISQWIYALNENFHMGRVYIPETDRTRV